MRGFIVVAVLWILAALSALVLIYLTYVTDTAVAVAVSGDRVESEALQSAAVELAVYRLMGVKEDARPTSGSFTARIGTAKVSVTFRSEAARIDLNAAPKSLLEGLMTGLGAAPSDAASYADHILAWRAPKTQQGDDDPENAFYRGLGLAYLPRHGAFPAAEELWLVQGIPPDLIERMLPFVTVFSGLNTVNIVDADPQVLAALPNMTPERLQEVLAARSDPTVDAKSLLGITGGNAATVAGSKAYRMAIAVDAVNGRRSTVEVVIQLLDAAQEPYHVLSWRDGFAGGTATQKGSAG